MRTPKMIKYGAAMVFTYRKKAEKNWRQGVGVIPPPGTWGEDQLLGADPQVDFEVFGGLLPIPAGSNVMSSRA